MSSVQSSFPSSGTMELNVVFFLLFVIICIANDGRWCNLVLRFLSETFSGIATRSNFTKRSVNVRFHVTFQVTATTEQKQVLTTLS